MSGIGRGLVDHGARRPRRAPTTADRRLRCCERPQSRGWQRCDERERDVCSCGSLDEHVDGVPGGRCLLDVGVVVGIEDHHASQMRHGCERRTPRSDNHRPTGPGLHPRQWSWSRCGNAVLTEPMGEAFGVGLVRDRDEH